MRNWEISLVAENERPQLLEFIRTNWNNNHIFLRDDRLLDWQHFNPAEGSFNFVAFRESGAITALLGFIPSNRWSSGGAKGLTSLALWKVAPECSVPGAGVALFRYLAKNQKNSTLFAIGVTDGALRIYKSLGFQVGVMDQWIMGPEIQSQTTGKSTFPNLNHIQVPWGEIIGPGARKELADVALFFGNRYSAHPYYSYEVHRWQIETEFLFTIHREVKGGGRTISRIVDVYGGNDQFHQLSWGLRTLAEERGWAYVDFVCHGYDPIRMRQSGFLLATDLPALTFPHHFEPFEDTNVRLMFFHTSRTPYGQLKLHLGDSDQDRPNLPRIEAARIGG
jgi:hypothetical protein